MSANDYDHVYIAPSLLNSHTNYLTTASTKPLRVCCYGSSSSDTPQLYLQEARHVGYILAKRGHTCVNGAGSFGCMAALNDGACKANGHIVGVIHELWLVDSGDSWAGVPVRDGGAHEVFAGVTQTTKTTSEQQNRGPIRELLVAGGKDLQERKRLLMEGADALLVLPGGPGTWDELWEAACARGIGLTKIPIVVVNVDGFYDPFLVMLQRAYEEKLTKLEPHQIVHFENTAEGAIQWIERVQGQHDPHVHLQARDSRAVIRKSSMMTIPVMGSSDSWFFNSLKRSMSLLSGSRHGEAVIKDDDESVLDGWLLFGTGVMVGTLGCGVLMTMLNKTKPL